MPCSEHPAGCPNWIAVPVDAPFTGLRDVRCEGQRYCWCGETCDEADGIHGECWARRYAACWAIRGLVAYFAPLNEAWLRKRFAVRAEAVRFGPVGSARIRRQQRQEAWRAAE